MNPHSSSAPVTEVLRQFTQSTKDCGCVIAKLAEGTHANVYGIRSGSNRPIWQTHHALVVKLYKLTGTPNFQFMREQYDSLSGLYAAVDGSVINGWKVFAPEPLYLCKSPPALVMSMVPGQKLSLYLDSGDDASFAKLDSLPRVIIAAMESYWSVGQTHGDLNFDNILCDIAERSVSFVDVGVPTTSFLSEEVTWHLASHDLGYMLFETGVRVKSTFRDLASRARHERFAESVLRAFIETIAPFEDKRRLLDEIQGCARGHLKTLELSWSPHGLWHAVVRSVASRRIDRLLAKLRTDARVSSTRHAPAAC